MSTQPGNHGEFSPKMQERLSDLHRKLVLRISYTAAWEELFTDEERNRLGEDLDQCWQRTPDLVQLWTELRGGSTPRAIVDLAYQLNYLAPADHERLLRGIGEGDPKSVGLVKPVWDAGRRELRYRGHVIRRLRTESIARNTSKILNAFQDADWPARVDYSVLISHSSKPLHDAVESLNNNLSDIRFHVDGDDVYWTED